MVAAAGTRFFRLSLFFYSISSSSGSHVPRVANHALIINQPRECRRSFRWMKEAA